MEQKQTVVESVKVAEKKAVPEKPAAEENKAAVSAPAAAPQPGLQVPSFSEGLRSFQDYAPFIYNVGSRACYGAAWGGLFGLVFFRGASSRKFCVIYGAGFGLGMCAPQVNQLWRDFFDSGPGRDLATTPKSDEEFYTELESIKQEITLRNKFKH